MLVLMFISYSDNTGAFCLKVQEPYNMGRVLMPVPPFLVIDLHAGCETGYAGWGKSCCLNFGKHLEKA